MGGSCDYYIGRRLRSSTPTSPLDPVKRAALFIRMNDLLIEDVVVIPVVLRHWIHAASHTLRGMALSPWDLDLWNLAYWYRET